MGLEFSDRIEGVIEDGTRESRVILESVYEAKWIILGPN